MKRNSTPATVAVYPRVYGESSGTTSGGHGGAGLSPRVRGILVEAETDYVCARSIPACTGNPGEAAPGWHQSAVYPRVYGESR